MHECIVICAECYSGLTQLDIVIVAISLLCTLAFHTIPSTRY